jgi:phospholipid/cholesterol/gamma-HCH transport system ATP-binding protein
MAQPPASDPHVALRHVRRAFGRRPIFGDLSCEAPRGKITVVVGGSGSGKSTLLRLVGGLIRPDAGQVLVDGKDVGQLPESQLKEVRFGLGMLFQNGALLDALTVFSNVAFPLREHTRMSEREIADAVHQSLRRVGLHDVDDLLVPQLSGGMRKRVALARAIVRRPAILLCDEPFSGLDPVSTVRIERLLVALNREAGLTMIVVSHDPQSTQRMADHVVALVPGGSGHGGAVEGGPKELLRHADPRVRALLGEPVAEELVAAEEQR